MLKLRLLGLTPRVSNSVGQGGTQEFAFLTSSHEMLLLMMSQDLTLRSTALHSAQCLTDNETLHSNITFMLEGYHIIGNLLDGFPLCVRVCWKNQPQSQAYRWALSGEGLFLGHGLPPEQLHLS